MSPAHGQEEGGCVRGTAGAAGTSDSAPPVTQASVPGAEDGGLGGRLHREAAGPDCPLKGIRGRSGRVKPVLRDESHSPWRLPRSPRPQIRAAWSTHAQLTWIFVAGFQPGPRGPLACGARRWFTEQHPAGTEA